MLAGGVRVQTFYFCAAVGCLIEPRNLLHLHKLIEHEERVSHSLATKTSTSSVVWQRLRAVSHGFCCDVYDLRASCFHRILPVNNS